MKRPFPAFERLLAARTEAEQHDGVTWPRTNLHRIMEDYVLPGTMPKIEKELSKLTEAQLSACAGGEGGFLVECWASPELFQFLCDLTSED